jgi:hypothetical protein
MKDATYTGVATGPGVESASGKLATTGGKVSSALGALLRSNVPAKAVIAMMLAAMTEKPTGEKTRDDDGVTV